jgi:uncharacterized damage-inducible protein DinB
MLGACIEESPESVWSGAVGVHSFSQVVFHTLYFTDLYLGRDDEESFRRQPFHLQIAALFADLPERTEPFEVPTPRSYDRSLLRAYLEFCRRKVREVMAAETEETLRAPETFRGEFSRAELHVYNIRHINHHVGQLSLSLSLDRGKGVDWVGSGWHGAVIAEHPE